MPDFLYDEKLRKLDHDFRYFYPVFYCTWTETAIILLFKFLTPNSKFPWAVSYLSTNFGGASAKNYTCFARKTALVMQNFWNLGYIRGGVKIFWRNLQKAHTLLISCVLSHRTCKSVTQFLRQVCARKKGHYKKSHRDSRIHGEYPTQPNLTQIGVWVGVANVTNRTKFGNDRLRECKVTEHRILPCSIGKACRL